MCKHREEQEKQENEKTDMIKPVIPEGKSGD